MGRFDRKYPKEAIEQLFLEVLDHGRSIREAVRVVAETRDVQIKYETARQYVKWERARRAGGDLAEISRTDPAPALDALTRRLIACLEFEAREIERGARHGKVIDLGRIDKVATTIERLRKGLAVGPKSPLVDAKGSGGDGSAAVRRLTAALESRAPTREGNGAAPAPSSPQSPMSETPEPSDHVEG